MGNLEVLQSKVERMLDGEKKRREAALQFVQKVTEIITPICDSIFMKQDEFGCVKSFGRDLYFRWEVHYGHSDTETVGFYVKYDEYLVWGTAIEDVKGTEFWCCVRDIIDFMKLVSEKIDEKEAAREKLLALLK